MSPRPAGHGETQPRLDDTRLPVVLLVLDGLGDRGVPELGGRTPSEAAATPVLDALAARGASGWHVPLGWGRAPSSETAHWAMFGYGDLPFPGRAVLEALGAGLDVPLGVPAVHVALRTSAVEPGAAGPVVRVTGRAAPEDADDAAALLAVAAEVAAAHGAELHPLSGGVRGEALLLLPGRAGPVPTGPDGVGDVGDVSDSDPFFEDVHPWLRPCATSPAGEPAAGALTALLLETRAALRTAAVNGRRAVPLDLLTTKWAGTRRPLPSYPEVAGVAGAAVTSSRLYRGFAALLGLASRDLRPGPDLEADLAARLAAAEELIREGARFVHVHTKATDEAGHTKDPHAKRDVLEALDPGLAGLLDLADRAVVAVTGDHATPSTGGVLHTADPTPLVVAGPTVRSDPVTAFGERPARAGDWGVVGAADLQPLLFGLADRPVFLGHRATARPTLALPDAPEPMPGG